MSIPQAYNHSPRPVDRPASPCPNDATPADRIERLNQEIERLVTRLGKLRWERRNLLIGESNRRRFTDPVFAAKFAAAREACGHKAKLPPMTKPQLRIYRKLRYKNSVGRDEAIRMALTLGEPC